MWPPKGTMMLKILETVNELSGKCVGGRVPVVEICLKMKKTPRESIRTTLSQLKINGYLETPIRGMYVLSKKGKKRLEKDAKE